MVRSAARPGSLFFFFNDTATTEIYTLSLHDALPISDEGVELVVDPEHHAVVAAQGIGDGLGLDRKSTRLNSSHLVISYAVFCLKKKKRTDELPDGYIADWIVTLDPDTTRLLVCLSSR